QKRSRVVLGSITVAGTILALFAAVSVTRTIRQRDEQIAEGTRALEARNRELDAFAGRVAHDLRGPLTTIRLAGARLASLAPEEENTNAILRRGITRMEALIEDLLALSRIEAQVAVANSQTNAIVKMLEEELAPQVKSMSGILRIQLEPATVRCNEGLLRQVL